MPYKLSKYQNYKPSGLDWLGDIPDGWEVKRLKELLEKIETGTSVNAGDVEAKENEFGILKTSCVYSGEFNYKENKTVFTEEITRLSCKLKNNSIIVSRMNTPELIGAAGLVRFAPDNIYLPDRLWQILFRKINLAYFHYFTKIPLYRYFIVINSIGASSSMQTLGQELFKTTPIPLPPLQTQIKIAKYLDQQTANIDKEIDLLTQKAEKYKQLKQTLISETVTGRNYKLLMVNDKLGEIHNSQLKINNYLKPSGVEWLGDIPEGWEVRRVKEIFEISRGRVIAQTELEDSGYPVYSSQTENDGCMGYIKTYDFNANALTWTTDGANAGTVFLRSGKFNCTNICGILLPKNKFKHYLEYLLHSVQLGAKHNKRIDTNGAKIMSNEMAIIKIVIPPKSHQKQIADYLDEQTGKIDQIISTINQKIDKLKEYRKVLINDVVVGKVRVEEAEDQPRFEIKVNSQNQTLKLDGEFLEKKLLSIIASTTKSPGKVLVQKYWSLGLDTGAFEYNLDNRIEHRFGPYDESINQKLKEMEQINLIEHDGKGYILTEYGEDKISDFSNTTEFEQIEVIMDKLSYYNESQYKYLERVEIISCVVWSIKKLKTDNLDVVLSHILKWKKDRKNHHESLWGEEKIENLVRHAFWFLGQKTDWIPKLLK